MATNSGDTTSSLLSTSPTAPRRALSESATALLSDDSFSERRDEHHHPRPSHHHYHHHSDNALRTHTLDPNPDALHHAHPPHLPALTHFLPLQPELVFARQSYTLPGLLPVPQTDVDPERWDRMVRQKSLAGSVNPQLQFDRLIGEREDWDWEKYRAEDLLWAGKGKAAREYYERMNRLIDCYAYVDRLLDSSLPQELLSTYNAHDNATPCSSGSSTPSNYGSTSSGAALQPGSSSNQESSSSTGKNPRKLRRRPSYLYRIADEESPLMGGREETTAESRDQVVKFAIYLNLVANFFLLGAKLAVTIMTSSLSVVASLVDGVMDMLSSVIIFITSRLVERKNHLSYPVGRSRLEPLGVLVFSVIMITSFVQVGQEGIVRLLSDDHKVVELGPWAIGIMVATVVIKGACWLWCRLVPNSSVQALAADALTDVVFNTFSILFPLVGHFLKIWWLDPLGGILLSVFVIVQWSRISAAHIRNLTGAAASPELISILLYLVMRFARAIKRITAIHAYHAGDRVHVEVDIILDPELGLKDAHDLGESLQFVIESLPVVERAFVHLDYDELNPLGHLR